MDPEEVVESPVEDKLENSNKLPKNNKTTERKTFNLLDTLE